MSSAILSLADRRAAEACKGRRTCVDCATPELCAALRGEQSAKVWADGAPRWVLGLAENGDVVALSRINGERERHPWSRFMASFHGILPPVRASGWLCPTCGTADCESPDGEWCKVRVTLRRHTREQLFERYRHLLGQPYYLLRITEQLAADFRGERWRWEMLRAFGYAALMEARGDLEEQRHIALTIAPETTLWRRTKGRVNHQLLRWDHGSYRAVLAAHGRLGRPRRQTQTCAELIGGSWLRVQ